MSSYSKEFETKEIERRREELQKEVNSFSVRPIAPDVFLKDPALRVAKQNYKDLKNNPVRYKETRDELLEHLVNGPIPRWGSINVKLTR